MTRLLIVTAVTAEADAVRAGTATITVEPVGVGPTAAAAGTARLLALAEAAGTPYGAVICAGIAGGFSTRAEVGDTVLATRSIAADLGAESPTGFLRIEELGFGTSALDADPVLLKILIDALPTAVTGEILTLATVTGSAATADALATRFPSAVAEAMEGFGVGTAAAQAGLPYAEIRTISNLIGPRDRAAWRLGEALAALTKAAEAIGVDNATLWSDRQ
jgi:futalosine hydrolase